MGGRAHRRPPPPKTHQKHHQHPTKTTKNNKNKRSSPYNRKCALDAGDYGLGFAANSLELGCDCAGHVVYFDGVVNDSKGAPVVIPNAICLHEEDHGLLWKHVDYRTGKCVWCSCCCCRVFCFVRVCVGGGCALRARVDAVFCVFVLLLERSTPPSPTQTTKRPSSSLTTTNYAPNQQQTPRNKATPRCGAGGAWCCRSS